MERAWCSKGGQRTGKLGKAASADLRWAVKVITPDNDYVET